MSARDWRSVSHRSPCGVCKSTKRCGYTLDGRVRKCCYALDGGVGHGSDDVGDFALYFNDTVPGAVRRSFEPPAESPVADPGTRHAVYAALLAACGLSDEHRAQLTRRGLSADDIAAAGYATLPRGHRERAAILATVAAGFGGIPTDVPGLHLGKLPELDGLLVPARDELGRIAGLKVRRDRGEPRYLWLSSNGQGGAKARNAAHVPVAAREMLSGAETKVARLTEGELKADVATSLSGVATLAVPGAMAARAALDALRALHVQAVLLSWDSDARTNPHVAGGLEHAAHLLTQELPGVALRLETWATDDTLSPKGVDDALAAGVALVVHEGQAAWRELVAILRASGREPRPETLARAGMEAEDEVEPVAIVQPAKKRAAQGPFTVDATDAPTDLVDWRAGLLTSASGQLKKSGIANVCTLLRASPDWKGRLSFNEMTQSILLDARPMTEVDVVRTRESIERAWGLDLGDAAVWSAALAVAHERAVHPVRDYLTAAEWDGVPRIHRLANEVLHARATPLLDLTIRRWLISAVARALRPGCKVDTALVLIGEQGHRKSSFFDALAGPWFADTEVRIGDKDGLQQIHAAWVTEWAEIDKITTQRHAGDVKAFISRKEDLFRPPYARTPKNFPRSCVIVGSTNTDQFLSDPTGARRFWCVYVRARVNIELLAELRDQVWAEAVAAYRAGERWHFEPDEEIERAKGSEAHRATDPWEPIVETWIAEKWPSMRHVPGARYLTTQLLLEKAIKLEPKDQKKGEEMHMGEVLRTLKFARRQLYLKPDERALYLNSRGVPKENIMVWLPAEDVEGVDGIEVEMADAPPVNDVMPAPDARPTHVFGDADDVDVDNDADDVSDGDEGLEGGRHGAA